MSRGELIRVNVQTQQFQGDSTFISFKNLILVIGFSIFALAFEKSLTYKIH